MNICMRFETATFFEWLKSSLIASSIAYAHISFSFIGVWRIYTVLKLELNKFFHLCREIELLTFSIPMKCSTTCAIDAKHNSDHFTSCFINICDIPHMFFDTVEQEFHSSIWTTSSIVLFKWSLISYRKHKWTVYCMDSIITYNYFRHIRIQIASVDFVVNITEISISGEKLTSISAQTKLPFTNFPSVHEVTEYWNYLLFFYNFFGYNFSKRFISIVFL